jgi:tetratricopeptide (TPR) repeat protein
MRNRSLRCRARWFACLVLCSLSASPLVAYPVLTFTVTSHKEPAAGAKAAGQPVFSNELAHSLLGILEPRDQASAQKSLQILSELHNQSGSAGYMLDVFQGNILLGLRDGKAGAEHLLAALSINPYLLGAWKDLGGHYYQSFQTDKAWDCWDAARRVNPQHPMLLRINEIERQLRTTFPEFF